VWFLSHTFFIYFSIPIFESSILSEKMSKIIYLDAYTLFYDGINRKELDSIGNITYYDRTPVDKIIERCQNAEIILTNKCQLNRLIISQLPNLKYIGVTATGYNIVDIEAAREYGITVTNVRGYSTNSVAQHTFTLILALLSKINDYAPKIATEWVSVEWCYFRHSLTELTGKTLGLVGFGDIAQKVAKIALAFEMRVIATRRNPLKGSLPEIELVGIDELLQTSDFVSLHAPLTIDNQAFINKKRLEMMKPTAYLINTARGGLINEQELADALNQGIIAGAGLDVLNAEPPQSNNPLLIAQNCIITPHQAWGSVEARTTLIQIVAENIKMYLNGTPQNVVN
jgi:glycerate dehydrogenase